MVGCGAIGCELLKNLAMLDIGTSGPGAITVTDPDFIENSNLNRQFLFRENHIRKSKSLVAQSQIGRMNKNLRINAYLEKVHPQNEKLFSDKFFSE
jgi:molybdopterin/thiamine biosynthesis adenylyltransferase